MDLDGTGGGGDGGQTPKTFAGIEMEKLNAALVEATGQEGVTIDHFNQIPKLQQDLTQVQQEYQSYKTKIENTRRHPLAEQINKLHRDGATDDEISQLLRLSTMPLDQMSNEDRIKLQYQMQHPGLSSTDIDLLLKANLGDPNADGLEDAQRAAIKAKYSEAGIQAKVFLNDKKVKAGEPQSVLTAQENRRKDLEISQSWQRLSGHAVNSLDKLSWNFGDKDNPIQFDFPLPAGAQEVVRKMTSDFAISQYKNGNLTLNENDFESKTLPALQGFAQKAVMFRYGDQILANVAKHIQAEVTKRVVKANAGLGGGGQGGKAEAEELRKKMRDQYIKGSG